MFLGEAVIGGLYFLYTRIESQRGSSQNCKESLLPETETPKIKLHPIAYMLPAILDSIGGACLFMGLTQV